MRAIRLVAVNVFRESVRDRVPYALVVFAVLLIAASYLIGQLTAGQDVKIIKDLGLAAIAAFGLFIAVFIGVGLVAKEVERRSIYALLSKPISRPQFIAGKYAGLVLTLIVHVVVMTTALYLVLAWLTYATDPAVRAAWDAPGTDPRILKAVFLTLVELMIVTGVAMLFSTFSTPVLSAALTFGVYIAGHFTADLRQIANEAGSPASAWIARAVSHALPDLAAFDVKTHVVHGLPVPAAYIAMTTAYGLAYIAALLCGGIYVFSRRDLK